MLNEVIISGRLGADPELRRTPSEKYVCTFNLAVNSGTKENQVTNWIPCVLWNGRAETFNSIAKKGQLVEVKGALRVDTFTTKDGVNARNIYVLVNSFSIYNTVSLKNDVNEEIDEVVENNISEELEINEELVEF